MKTSTERILTTHVGSLPRPPELLEFLEARETGPRFEQTAFDACLSLAVREIVEKQVAAGIDSVCDGELGKISYTFYVRHRLSDNEFLRIAERNIAALNQATANIPPQAMRMHLC
jgi:5-methyltetrahydropteroyltriglutamate--homocysteine methyltransferase